MKLIYIFLILVSVFTLFSCKKNVPFDFTDTTDNVQVYIPQAARNSGFTTINIVRPAANKPDTIVHAEFTAYFAGYANASTNIDVEFKIDYSKLDSLNKVEKINLRSVYEAAPDSIISTQKLNTSIKSGSRISDAITVGIKAKKVQLKHKYIIPISIKSVSNGYQINKNLSTIYYTIEVK